ncbi:MAG: cytochrome C oxidase subunit IV family protein [Halieaceae bacterium]|nr:cytochrome C oxidase subunit IV family protein [Halieaceae bacterium]
MTDNNTPLVRCTIVCLLLVLATLLSWQLGHSELFTNVNYTIAVILLIAIIKIRYVILDFMEVRHAPAPLRITVELWCVTAFSLMCAVATGILSF